MKVLLLGGGGREHAIGWKLVQSPHSVQLISLPGNPGLAQIGSVVEGIDATDVGAVAAFAAHQSIDLVVVGPEAPLAAGVVDALQAVGIPAFGPSKAAARLEASKTFAKQIMDEADIPTARWGSFATAADALAYLDTQTAPYVIKADGLAAGKGVLVTGDIDAARTWINDCLDGRFGAGEVVIEEHLEGPELSVFAVCDGTDAVLMEPARDYKRLKTNDEGPNTGGMGSFSPVGDLPDGIMDFTLDRVVRPVLATMAAAGTPYVGFLYVGYVLTESGPKVLEFNCRLGDPETQVVLARLETDLIDIVLAALEGTIGTVQMEWSPHVAVNVVLAADGYPDSPVKGVRLKRTTTSVDAMVFHAGTRWGENTEVISSGGRVLNVVATGETRAEARTKCYAAIDTLRWPGVQYRSDIARDR